MVRAGCYRNLKGDPEVLYGDDCGTFTVAWTTFRNVKVREYHKDEVCGSLAVKVSEQLSINYKYRYCESCARRFGWIW